MLVTMNDSDINRFKVIQDVCDRRIRRVDAADILDLSVRQSPSAATYESSARIWPCRTDSPSSR